MKKTIQILFFVFLSMAVFAQEKKDTLKKINKWDFALSSGGTLTTMTKVYDFPIKYKLKYNIDAHIDYNCFRHSIITLGFNYCMLEYQDTEISYYAYNKPFTILEIYNYQFLSSYLLFKQSFKLKKIGFDIGIGPQIAKIVDDYDDILYIGDPNSNFHERFKRFKKHEIAFEGKLNILVSYKFNNSISIFLESSFFKSIIGISEAYAIANPFGVASTGEYKYDPNYYSLNFGILYHFKNK